MKENFSIGNVLKVFFNAKEQRRKDAKKIMMTSIIFLASLCAFASLLLYVKKLWIRLTCTCVCLGFMLIQAQVSADLPPLENSSCRNLSTSPNHILFLMRSGNLQGALNAYRQYINQIGHHDLDLLQQVALLLLNQGMESADPETNLLTLFGAGVSLNEGTLPILEAGIRNPEPQLQLVAIHFLAAYQDDEGNLALKKALRSNFLLIRLEGILCLAKRKAPEALSQIDALISKVIPEVLPVFPKLYAILGTPAATRQLRKMLSHPDEKVRLEALLSAGQHGRDDLLPSIRSLASHHNAVQQEACAWALGILKDQSAIPRLQYMVQNGTSPTARLAALQSLALLNDQDAVAVLKDTAQRGDLFAISALSQLKGCEELLSSLMQDCNPLVRLNAGLALLSHRDPRCLPVLCDILIRDSRDLILDKVDSPGGAFTCYRVIPSARQNLGNAALVEEIALATRTEILAKAIELPEENFLALATLLFDQQQNDLVPILIEALQTLRTPKAIALLKQQQQRAGAPLLRSYCNLALYKLKEEGPYLDHVKNYIKNEYQRDLIRFRPVLPWATHEEQSPYQLSPDERSRLLVDSLEAVAQQQNDDGVSLLLDAIQYGNQKNRYALAGLLLRASQ